MTVWTDALPRDAAAPGGLIAGPIVRRAAPDGVSVWVATAGPVKVDGSLLDAKKQTVGSGTASSYAFGAHLHVTIVTMQASSSGALPTDALLAYDLKLTLPDKRTFTLRDYGGGPLAYPGQRLPALYLSDGTPMRLLHASCRKLHGAGGDALPIVDDLLGRKPDDLTQRAAALMLTGDQIYADDVAEPLATPITQLAAWLLGYDERLPTPSGDLPVSQKQDGNWAPFFAQVFRPDNAKDPINSTARNQASGFGEFAALYLLSLHDVLWPPDSVLNKQAPASKYPRDRFQQQLGRLTATRNAVKKVRRALANVATYMIFDDHEVTDDWNLDEEITSATQQSDFGKRIVGNALAAYLAFQGWGNEPSRHEDTVRAAARAIANASGREAIDDQLASYASWSYTTPTNPPVLVLDTRTQRVAKRGDPSAALLGPDGLAAVEAQLGGGSSTQPVIIVSATPVFGVPEAEDYLRSQVTRTKDPFKYDYEFWSANVDGFGRLLDKLVAGQQRVYLLSGDVHYGFVQKVWLSAYQKSAEIVQFTSSAMQNMPEGTSAIGAKLLNLNETTSDVAHFRATAVTKGAPIYGDLFALQRSGAAIVHRVVSRLVVPDGAGGPVILQSNVGEIADEGQIVCRLHALDGSGKEVAYDVAVDPFGQVPTPASSGVGPFGQAQQPSSAPFAQAGNAAPVAPAAPPVILDDDEKRVVRAMNPLITHPADWAALLTGLPLSFVAGWIFAESRGQYDEVTTAQEAGYFQIEREWQQHRGLAPATIIASTDSSMRYGLTYVQTVRSAVARACASRGVALDDDDLRLRLTKLYHTVGAGAWTKLLDAVVQAKGTSLAWSDIDDYWRAHATKLHSLKLTQYTRMTHNVNLVMDEGAKLGRAMGVP